MKQGLIDILIASKRRHFPLGKMYVSGAVDKVSWPKTCVNKVC
jgi:hypothetical protein